MQQRTVIVCFIVSFLSTFLNARITDDNFDLYKLFQQRDSSSFTTTQRHFQKEMLKEHNEHRARHCAPPLTLDDDLNQSAQDYATYLAETNSFDHSDSPNGENLFEMTSSKDITNYDAAKITLLWYDEIKLYNFKNPEFSEETGHFTQLIWKETTKLGIGSATGRRGSRHTLFVVAHYSPAGNVDETFSENVHPHEC